MPSRAASEDMAAAEPHLGAAMRDYALRVDLRMASGDGMETDDIHHLMAGSSALDAIQSSPRLGGVEAPDRILGFGSGAGRVTRWLRAAYPEASLACCDLRPEDMAFRQEVFGAEAWRSTTDIEAFDLRGPHDLIWMGAVLTYLDEARTRRLVDKAMDPLASGGLLVATTIGRVARERQDRDGAYLSGSDWPAVKRATTSADTATPTMTRPRASAGGTACRCPAQPGRHASHAARPAGARCRYRRRPGTGRRMSSRCRPRRPSGPTSRCPGRASPRSKTPRPGA